MPVTDKATNNAFSWVAQEEQWPGIDSRPLFLLGDPTEGVVCSFICYWHMLTSLSSMLVLRRIVDEQRQLRVL